ncbi:lipopolysaccharide transport periplasmic protein LptA [Ramlibacter sp. MAHUQ-53]|uniref:lipopolysaccharide transport periplasmic protein LptA n=1 Tax=unclassified Ramlibacter TaxID=2617605 RepID=UPI00363CE257
MKRPILSLSLTLVALLVAGSASAERADRSKPMNIEADTLRHDDLKQVSVFTGQVVATKGTIVIRGARMEVRQDAEGYQYGVVTAEPGKRAFWRQKREGVDEYVEGEGDTIEYDGKADRVRFNGRAELRRYRGAVLADETQGSVITYENTTDVFTVDGAPLGNRQAQAGNPGGRVRAVLAPRGAASAPAAPAAPLRPSTTLGGERK